MFKQILFFSPTAKWRLMTAVLCAVCAGVILLYEVHLLADLTNRAFLGGEPFVGLQDTIALLVMVILTRAIFFYVSEWLTLDAATRIKSDLRAKMVEHATKLGPVHLRHEQRGELLSTFMEGVEQLETYIAKYIPQAILASMLPAAIWVVVVGFDWISAIVLALALPLLIFFLILVGWGSKRAADRQFHKLQVLGGHLLDVLRGLPTLHWFQRIDAQIQIIRNISEQYREATMRTLRIAFLSAFVTELFATLSTAIVAVFLGLRLLEGQMAFVHAFYILLLVPEFFAPVRAVGVQYHAAQNGIAAMKRLLEWLKIERQEAVLAVRGSNMSQIEWKDVSVISMDGSKRILDGISFVLQPGKSIAITGPSGSGKSTLLETLLTWHPIQSGAMIWHHPEGHQLTSLQWLHQIAYCSQQVDWLQTSIRENVTMYRPDATECEIWDALQRVRLTEWIAEMPAGLETILTEDAAMSGGQAQRLQLARAFLSARPILLLDEATTQLDAQTAMIIQKQLGKWVAEKPTERFLIFVAHHQEQVRMADQVLYLEKGKLIRRDVKAAVS